MRTSLVFLFIATIFLSACTSKKEKASAFMSAGKEKIRSGEYKTAIESFDKAIDIDPDNFEAYYYRGNAKFNLKMSNEAIADYNKAIELKPDYADAYFNRALCKQYINDFDGACSDRKKAIELGRPNTKDLLKKVCQ